MLVSGPKRARRMSALLATFLFCGAPGTVYAHAIHTTLTEIVLTEDGTVSVRIRTFADDFSAAVARHEQVAQRKDYVVADGEAARYLDAALKLTDSRGMIVSLTMISQRRTGDVVWLELRASKISLSGASIRNAMLFAVHEDQVNIVKASYGHTSYTTLFSSGDGAKKLP